MYLDLEKSDDNDREEEFPFKNFLWFRFKYFFSFSYYSLHSIVRTYDSTYHLPGLSGSYVGLKMKDYDQDCKII